MMRVSPLSGFHYSTDPFWFCWAQNTYNFVHGPTSRGVLTQWTPGSYWQSRVDKCCSQHVLHLQGTRAWQQLVTNNSFHNSAEQSRVFDFFFSDVSTASRDVSRQVNISCTPISLSFKDILFFLPYFLNSLFFTITSHIRVYFWLLILLSLLWLRFRFLVLMWSILFVYVFFHMYVPKLSLGLLPPFAPFFPV